MRLVVASCLLVAFAAGASAASGDFEVQSSNVPAYKSGQALAKGSSVSVPDGGKITPLGQEHLHIEETGGCRSGDPVLDVRTCFLKSIFQIDGHLVGQSQFLSSRTRTTTCAMFEIE